MADLGCGCGVVAVMMAWRGRGRRFTGIELQSGLAALARGNVAGNGLSGRVEVLEMDLREVPRRLAGRTHDLVVANPPHHRAGCARTGDRGERTLARHEIAATARDFLAAAGHLLGPGGRYAAVYPPARLADVLTEAPAHGLFPKTLTPVRNRPGDPPWLFHIECGKGGGLRGAPRQAPAVVLADEAGRPTGAYLSLFAR